jgi:hypothetical protein
MGAPALDDEGDLLAAAAAWPLELHLEPINAPHRSCRDIDGKKLELIGATTVTHGAKSVEAACVAIRRDIGSNVVVSSAGRKVEAGSVVAARPAFEFLRRML